MNFQLRTIAFILTTLPLSLQAAVHVENADSTLPRPNGGPTIAKLYDSPNKIEQAPIVPNAKSEYLQKLCPSGFLAKNGSSYFNSAIRHVVIYTLNGKEVGSSISDWVDVDEDCTRVEERTVACPVDHTGNRIQRRKIATKNNNQYDYGVWELFKDNCKKIEVPKPDPSTPNKYCLYDANNYIYVEERDYLGTQYEEYWTMHEIRFVYEGKIIFQEIEKNKLPRPIKIGNTTYSLGKIKEDKTDYVKNGNYSRHYTREEICLDPKPVPPVKEQWVKTDYTYGFFVEFDGDGTYFGSSFWYGSQFTGKVLSVYNGFYWAAHGLKNGWTHNYNYAGVNKGLNTNHTSAYANTIRSSMPGTILKDSTGREFKIGPYIGYENTKVEMAGYTLFFSIEEKKK